MVLTFFCSSSSPLESSLLEEDDEDAFLDAAGAGAGADGLVS